MTEGEKAVKMVIEDYSKKDDLEDRILNNLIELRNELRKMGTGNFMHRRNRCIGFINDMEEIYFPALKLKSAM